MMAPLAVRRIYFTGFQAGDTIFCADMHKIKNANCKLMPFFKRLIFSIILQHKNADKQKYLAGKVLKKFYQALKR